MPRAVITGGAGFLGSHLCDRLLNEGLEVVVVDNLVTGNLDNLAHRRDDSMFTFVNADVSDGIDVDGPVDYVFHLASPASPDDFPKIPIEIMRVNSEGTRHALDLANRNGARFLIASTSEVYGDPLIHPQTEDYLGNVNSIGVRGVYDESKRFGEAITMAYNRFYGTKVRIVRIFNTYGERMRLSDGRVVPNFIGQALREEPITVYGTGNQTRSFCYVSDLVEGIWRLVQSEHTGPVNIGNPTERSMLEFAQEIKRLTESSSDIVFEPLPTADDPKQRRPDITRAQSLLGWHPRVDLIEGLTRTIDYFRSRV